MEAAPLLGEGGERARRRSLEGGRGGGGEGGEGAALSRGALLGFLAACLSCTSFGFDIGSTACAVRADQLLADFGLPAQSWQQGLLVTASLYGATAASFALFMADDAFGRRQEMVLGNTLFLAGTAVSALAPGVGAVGAGRFLFGLGVGAVMHGAPPFIAETSPAALRGLLISLKEAFVVGGVALGYFVGIAYPDAGGWRHIWAMDLPFAAVALAFSLIVQESPRWLAARGFRVRAEESLAFYRGGQAPPQELRAILAAGAASGGASSLEGRGGRGKLSWRGLVEFWRPLEVSCGLVFLQQVSGQPSVMYYTPTIFEGVGMSGQTAVAASGFVSLVKMAATGLSATVVDRYGRRPLLLLGTGLMAVALAVLAGASFGDGRGHRGGGISAVGDLTLLGLGVFVVGYQVGFGPISWIMVSEVAPLRARGTLVGIATTVNFMGNIIAGQLVPIMLGSMEHASVWLIFLVITLLSLLFIYHRVPETKGRSLEDIERLIADPRGAP